MSEVRHRIIETNGIRMHLAEQGEGPLVLLCHGFPESWYSWRHQLLALAEAGFRAVAPDMRGYGGTDQPPEIDQYTLLHSIGDMVGLLDVLGVKQAVIRRPRLGCSDGVGCGGSAARSVSRRCSAESNIWPTRSQPAHYSDATERRHVLLPALFPDTGGGRGGI
jgi:hypothetical protein